jgi:hypothetical protein
MAARNAVASPPFQFEPCSGLEKYQECQQSLPLDIQGLERTATLGVAHVKIGDMTEMQHETEVGSRKSRQDQFLHLLG